MDIIGILVFILMLAFILGIPVAIKLGWLDK
jgi:hypothetical protein